MATLHTVRLGHGDSTLATDNTGGLKIKRMYISSDNREDQFPSGQNTLNYVFTATMAQRGDINVLPGVEIPDGYVITASANNEHQVVIEYYKLT